MNPIREAAYQQIADIRGAFLRCDRGEGLYITNAALKCDCTIDWTEVGFEARDKGKMTFLVPKDLWIQPFEEWLRPQVRYPRLYENIGNADFGSIEEADRRLWVEGIKQLEIGSNRNYEKAVRQRAAVCLRTKHGGGTIRVCALIADALRLSEKEDERI